MKGLLLIHLVQVRDNIKAFVQTIIKHLKKEDRKLPKLFFAFHTASRYDVVLAPATMTKAEEHLELIEFFEERYKELSGKRYFRSLNLLSWG